MAPAGLAFEQPAAAVPETQRLRDQLQRLKGELMRTSRAHEEEQTRAEAEAEARIAALEAELSAARQAAQAVKSELSRAQANGDIGCHAYHAGEAPQVRPADEGLAAEAEQLRRELQMLRTEHAAIVAGRGSTEGLARDKQHELETRVRDAEAQCAESRTEVQNSRRVHEELQAQLRLESSALAQQVQQAEAATQAALEKLNAERGAHAKATEKLEHLRQTPAQQEQMQGLQEELDRARADVEGFEELHDATVAEVADLRAQLENRAAAEEPAQRENLELQRLQEELDRARADVEGFEELHDATVAEVADLRTQLEARTIGAQAAAQQQLKLQEELDRARADVEGFEELHDATVAEVADLRAQLDAQIAQTESAARDMSELRAQITTSSAQRGTADEEVAALRADAARHQQAASAGQQAISRLQQQLEAAEAALAGRDAFWQAELAAARVAHERMVGELQQRVAELEASLAASSNSQTCGSLDSHSQPICPASSLDLMRRPLNQDGFSIRMHREYLCGWILAGSVNVRWEQNCTKHEGKQRKQQQPARGWTRSCGSLATRYFRVCRKSFRTQQLRPACLVLTASRLTQRLHCRATGCNGSGPGGQHSAVGAGSGAGSAVRSALRKRQPAVTGHCGHGVLDGCWGPHGAGRSPAAAAGREPGPRRRATGAAG